MSFDLAVLAPLTLATSLAGALVLTATLSAPAYAEGDGTGSAALDLRAPGGRLHRRTRRETDEPRIGRNRFAVGGPR